MRSLEGPVRTSSPEETRARILAATREIFARNGTRGTTTREVADAAGVNEATIFRHFGSKTAMLDAMREQFSRIDELHDILASSTGDVVSDLRRVAGLVLHALRNKRDLISVSLAEGALDPASELCWRGPVHVRTVLAQYLAERVADGTLAGDPVQHARAFLGLLFSYVIARRLWDSDEADDRDAVEYFVRLFLHGATRSGSEG